MATSSRARKRLSTLRALQTALAGRRSTRVPLLALRIPEFERIAWREGKTAARRMERTAARAFLSAAHEALRAGDLAAHDPGSDVFVIAMAARARAAMQPSPVDCRSVLERVAAAVSMTTDLRIETGWTVLTEFDDESLEPEIRSALERGERERERYEFFSAVGHELRTPLTSIRGYLETLLESDLDRETALRFLQTARREALRMGRLVDGMFEFSLLDLSAGAILGRTCPVQAQIESACEVVAPAARARNMSIRRGGEEAAAAIDPDACLQMLVNLLDNAIKYGRDGGCIAVSSELQGSDVAIAVDDDGPGVAPKDRESIFGLRVRGPQTANRPGTGIGLAIVKMIAERAGGRIAVLESPLGGARFQALIPRKADSAKLSS